MNIEKMKRAWYPLIPSKQLKDKPVHRELLGQQLVLVRLNGQAARQSFDCCRRDVCL